MSKKAGKKGKGKPQAKKAEQTVTSRQKPFRDRVSVFVAEYSVSYNGAQAAIKAGYPADRARISACELLARPDVRAAVDKAREARIARIEIKGDDVIRRFFEIATADARDLTELRRECCRFCYGHDHRYQRTPREMEEAREQWGLAIKKAQKDADVDAAIEPFDEAGGLGWNPNRDPHPDCPECFGRGEERAYFKDSRNLSPQAALLYAGVKQTQHGLEIKTHDQVAALVKVGDHLGLFKKKLEHSTPAGAPFQIQQILDDIDGSDTGLSGESE